MSPFLNLHFSNQPWPRSAAEKIQEYKGKRSKTKSLFSSIALESITALFLTWYFIRTGLRSICYIIYVYLICV
jgi:hypothetical protein